jgi:hypothetical protein
MLLYHFTAIELLDSILENGLNRGDVAITPRGVGINAVWLTSDLKPAGHGLTQERKLTDAERELLFQIHGTRPSAGAKLPNKRAIRITVKLRSNDPSLKKWLKWAAKRIDKSWLNVLNRNPDGDIKRHPRTWYLCFRTIEPHEFVAVEHLRDGVPTGPAAIWHDAI